MIVVIQYVNVQVVIEVDGMYGNAAGVANRLRSSGLAAKKVGDQVHVNGQAEFPPNSK